MIEDLLLEQQQLNPWHNAEVIRFADLEAFNDSAVTSYGADRHSPAGYFIFHEMKALIGGNNIRLGRVRVSGGGTTAAGGNMLDPVDDAAGIIMVVSSMDHRHPVLLEQRD